MPASEMGAESVPSARYVNLLLTMEDLFFDQMSTGLLTLNVQFILRETSWKLRPPLEMRPSF